MEEDFECHYTDHMLVFLKARNERVPNNGVTDVMKIVDEVKAPSFLWINNMAPNIDID